MIDWNRFKGFYKNLSVTNKLEHVPYVPNSKSEWLAIGDTEERYKNNLENRLEDLLKDDLVGKNISYSFNSEGFRCKDFETNNNIMFLGCSATLGNGVKLEETYPEIVAKELRLNCCNLGIDGASNDTVFRLFYAYFEKINPEIVVVLSPFMERLEYITKDGPIILRPTQLGKTTDKIDTRFEKFYKSIITEDDNFILNRQKNLGAIKSYCTESRTNFLILNREEMEQLDNARDLIHPGIKSHKKLAEKILDRL